MGGRWWKIFRCYMFTLGWEDFPNIHKHSQDHTCVHRGCVIVFKTTLKNTSSLPHRIPGNELQPSVFARTTSATPRLPNGTFTVKSLLRFSSSQRCVGAPCSTFTVQTHPGSLCSLSLFMWFFQKKETFPGSRRWAITPSFVLLTQSCKPGYVMTPAYYVSSHFGPFLRETQQTLSFTIPQRYSSQIPHNHTSVE